MKISNFLKTHFLSIILTFFDDFTLNSDNNKSFSVYFLTLRHLETSCSKKKAETKRCLEEGLESVENKEIIEERSQEKKDLKIKRLKAEIKEKEMKKDRKKSDHRK